MSSTVYLLLYGVWFGTDNVCVSGVADPNDTLTGFAKATKTHRAAKWYWRPLNSKRSLPVLKWTSESVSLCRIYIIIISSPGAIT